MKAGLVVWVAIVGCGRAQQEKPVVVTAQKAVAVESAKAADLTPGTFVVVSGVGLMQVVGPHEYQGKPGVKFSNERSGTGFLIDVEGAKDPKVVRAVISKAEAERRLAMLEDTTPVTDVRSAKERYVEFSRTMARGTELQKIGLLRAQYASTFSAGARNMNIYYLEEAVLPELAHVLGRSEKELAEKLSAVHSEHGAYAKSAKVRPPEPEPVPPTDPWGIKGHEYVGSFVLEGDSLVAGDPVYVTSKHDEPAQELTKNVRIPALAGRWLCYVELDPKDPSDVTMSFIAIHESAKDQFDGARRKAGAVAKLWVDSGRMAVIDAAIRDDAAFDDARLFGADDHGVIGGRGCEVTSGGGDGTYTTRVLERDGKAIYVHVDFTGESRDFLKDAKAKLKL